MKTADLAPIPQLSDFPEAERTARVTLLLQLCQQQREQLGQLTEQLALQAEQIQQLKDEIAILKGQKRAKGAPENQVEYLDERPAQRLG